MTQQPINWDDIRALLKETAALLDGGEQSDMMRERTLQRRADQYATPAEKKQSILQRLSILEIRLGDERYAVTVQHVTAIADATRITPVPCVPSYYLGLCNLRGKMYSVLDLEKFFGLDASEAATRSTIVVVKSHNLEIGLIADSITSVIERSLNDFIGGQSLGYDAADAVSGVSQDGLILLDIGALFSDPRIRIYEEVT